MKLSAIFREAAFNVLHGAAAWWFEVPVLTLVLALGLGIDAHAQTSALISIADRRALGGYGAVVAGGVDGERCEALNGHEQLHAGASRTGAPVFLSAQPGSSVQVIEVTPRAASFYGIKPSDTAGVYITSPLAAELADTSTLRLVDGSSVRVNAVVSPPVHVLEPSRAIIAPTPASGDFDKCLIERWPARPEDDELLLAAALTTRLDQTEIRDLNRQHVTTSSPRTELKDRPTRRIPSMSVGGVCLAVVITFRLRRRQLSMARHVGVSRAALMLMSALEHGSALLISTALAAPIIFLATRGLNAAEAGYVLASSAAWATAAIGLGLLAALAGAGLVREGDVLTRLRDP